MLRDKNHNGKTDSYVRTWKSSGWFFAGGLKETHEFAEEITVGDFVERRRKVKLWPRHRQDDEYDIKQVERTDKHKNNLVYQFFTKEIAPERRSEKDKIIGKISEIHQFAEPCPRHSFAKLKTWLTIKQNLVGFHEMMV